MGIHFPFRYSDGYSQCIPYYESLIFCFKSAMSNAFDQEIPEYEIYFVPDSSNPYCIRTETPQKIYLVTLPAYYCQFAYQFAHELCHLLIGEGTPEEYGWLEESLCELASLYFMDFIDPQLHGFDLRTYTENIRKDIDLFDTTQLFDPGSKISDHLSKYRYDRNKNRYIACLLEPFASDPQFWILFKNISKADPGFTFEELLSFLEITASKNSDTHFAASFTSLKAGISAALKPDRS